MTSKLHTIVSPSHSLSNFYFLPSHMLLILFLFFFFLFHLDIKYIDLKSIIVGWTQCPKNGFYCLLKIFIYPSKEILSIFWYKCNIDYLVRFFAQAIKRKTSWPLQDSFKTWNITGAQKWYCEIWHFSTIGKTKPNQTKTMTSLYGHNMCF